MKNRLEDLIDSLVGEELARRAKPPPHRSWIRRHRILVGGGVLAVIMVSAVTFAYPALTANILHDNHCSSVAQRPAETSSRDRIAMVDSLSVENPAPTLVQTVRRLANGAGTYFDYYNADSATVNLILNLPRMNYSLVVFRIHSGPEVLITSEPYSQQRYVVDQLRDNIWATRVNQTLYFGINPSSIATLMCGRFHETMILAMGCDGMNSTDLADAFVQIGARVFIGWNGLTTIGHSDSASSLVLEMLLEHLTVSSAVTATMHQIGADPTYGSRLLYYPATQGQSTI